MSELVVPFASQENVLYQALDGAEQADFHNSQENQRPVRFSGVGDTFVAEITGDPVELPLIRDVDESVDIDGFMHAPTPVRSLIVIDGNVRLGIDADGLVRYRDYNFEDPSIDDIFTAFAASIDRKKRLAELGITPIFMPNKDFRFEDCSTPYLRQLGAVILASLLRRQPSLIENLGSARQDADILARRYAPKYLVTRGRDTVAVSDLSHDEIGYPTALFFRGAKRLDPTVHYLSSSHVAFRALFAQRICPDEGWKAKGMFGDENSADSPIALQRAFALLMQYQPPANQDRRNLQRSGFSMADIFTHTVRGEDVPDDSPMAAAESILLAHAIDERGRVFTHSDSEGYGTTAQDWFDEEFRPELGHELDSWQVLSSKYGTVTCRVYRSRYGVEYLINEANVKGQVRRWIGTGEAPFGNMSDLGILTQWPVLHPVVMRPPVEHAYSESGGSNGYETSFTLTDFDRFINLVLSSYGHAATK